MAEDWKYELGFALGDVSDKTHNAVLDVVEGRYRADLLRQVRVAILACRKSGNGYMMQHEVLAAVDALVTPTTK